MTGSIPRDLAVSVPAPGAVAAPIDEPEAAAFAAILAVTPVPIEDAPQAPVETTPGAPVAAPTVAGAGDAPTPVVPAASRGPAVTALIPESNAPFPALLAAPASGGATPSVGNDVLPAAAPAPAATTAPAAGGSVESAPEAPAGPAAPAPASSARPPASGAAPPGAPAPPRAPAVAPAAPTASPAPPAAAAGHSVEAAADLRAPEGAPARPSPEGAAAVTDSSGVPGNPAAAPPAPRTATPPPEPAPRSFDSSTTAPDAQKPAAVTAAATTSTAPRAARSESIATRPGDFGGPAEHIATPVAGTVASESPAFGDGAFAGQGGAPATTAPAPARPTHGAPASATTTLDGILEQVRLHTSRGTSRIEIAVDPPELGHLAIRLVLRGDRLVGDISAESRDVAKLLESGLDRLRETMREAGVRVDAFEVRTSADAHGESRGPSLHGHGQPGTRARGYRATQRIIEKNESETPTASPPTYGVDGRVDVMV